MKITLSYYQQWMAWAVAMALKMSTPRSPRLPEFLTDLSGIYLWWPQFIDGLPKGSGITLYLNALKFIARNPDPLKPLRDKMDAMQAKWNSV